MKHFRSLSMLAAAFLLAVSSSPLVQGENKPAANSEAAPLKIGLLTERSGPSAQNGVDIQIGHAIARALYAPDDRAGGRRLQFILGDSQGEGRAGVAEFQRMSVLERTVAVALNRSQVGMPINPISKRLGVPIASVVGHKDLIAGNPFAYRFWLSSETEGRALAEAAAKQGLVRAALITAEDEYCSAISDSFIKHFKKLGGEITYKELVPPSEIDFQTITTRVLAAHSDFILVNLTTTGLGPFIKKLHEHGMRRQLFSNIWIQNIDTLTTAGSDALEGAIFVTVNMRKAAFVREFQQRAPGRQPSFITYGAYTALAFLLQVIRSHPDLSTPAELQTALLAAKSVDLADGPLLIHNREAVYEPELNKYVSGQAIALGGAVSNLQ